MRAYLFLNALYKNQYALTNQQSFIEEYYFWVILIHKKIRDIKKLKWIKDWFNTICLEEIFKH